MICELLVKPFTADMQVADGWSFFINIVSNVLSVSKNLQKEIERKLLVYDIRVHSIEMQLHNKCCNKWVQNALLRRHSSYNHLSLHQLCTNFKENISYGIFCLNRWIMMCFLFAKFVFVLYSCCGFKSNIKYEVCMTPPKLFSFACLISRLIMQ